MELDRLSVDLRPRPAWEAVDLGFRMARAHYGRLLGVTALVTAPIFVLAHASFGHWPWLALLLPWWTKPIWERWPLHVLSRELFGERVGMGDALRGVGRAAFRDALPWLTIRRLSPTRSMDLPVTQLEGLVGPARARRLALLRRGRTGSAAMGLTVVLAHVELALPLAILVLVQMLTPDSVDWSVFGWAFGDDDADRLHTFVGGLLGHAAALVVAPFYVAGGFSLYVHRRSLLEGWDLEIAFRRIARRLHDAGPRAAAAVIGTLGLALAVPGPADAEPPAAESAAPEAASTDSSADDTDEAAIEVDIEILAERARADIRAVLEDEAFHATRTVSLPRLVHDCEWTPEEEDEPSELPGWLRALLEWVAGSAEVAFVAAFVLAVAYVAWRTARIWAPPERPRARLRPMRPQRLMGLDVRPGSLPTDIPSAVLALQRAGRPRDALALLYRATLARIVDVHAVSLAESDTEHECLAAAQRRLDAERAGLFADLTGLWLAVAYAHRSPDDERVARLCAAWERLFAATEVDAAEEPRGDDA